jgi:nicotinate dehydrogenase subunit A
MALYRLTINGEPREIEANEVDMLLYLLRDELQLNGPKFGCGVAQCGACTVLANGQPTRSCQTPVASVADGEITTLEGLGTDGEPGAVQQAFIAEQAAQCGYCINGMIMTTQALLDRNPDPSEEEIRNALNGNLCRCGTHTRIMRAVKRAASEGAKA